MDGYQSQRGERQIVVPMTQEQFDACWHDAEAMRTFLDGVLAQNPELFPTELRTGYAFHRFGRASQKLDGMK